MSGRPLRLVAVLVVALTAVALLAIGSASGPAEGAAGDPSSRSSGPDGTLALYTWLGDLGFTVHRASGDLDLGATDVLVSVDPIDTYTDAEIARVDAFLRSGGELILAVDPVTEPAAQPLLDRLGLAVDHRTADEVALPTAPLEPAGALRRVAITGGSLDLSRAGVPLLRTGDGATALAAFQVGTGSAYVLGTAYPLSNEGLRSTRPGADGTLVPTGSDADALVLALLERSRPAAGGIVRVAFDEVHHGEGATGGLGAILIAPVGLALLLALLVVLAWIGTSGRRLGRPLPAGDPTAVPSAASFVRAMAQLYERSAQRGAVAARYAQELKGRVSAATGIDPHLDDGSFIGALAGHGRDRADTVARALAEARRLAAGTPSDAQLLELARTLDAVESQWTAGAPV